MLEQRMTLGVGFSMEDDRIGKLYEIIDFWEHDAHLRASFEINGEEHTIEYVFAPQSFLQYVEPKEKFGFHVHGMIFINANLLKSNPQWIPYILMKLYAERFIDPDVDESGRVKHWQALFGTIRLAGMTMGEKELHEFLRAVMEHEQTQYFQLDEQAREFVRKGGGSLLEAKRKYLERHHKNQWVVRGRKEEEIVRLTREETSVFRNHAEAIYQRLLADQGIASLYETAQFIHQLMTVNPKTPVVVSERTSAIAYLLTREANKIADLVQFVDARTDNPCENVIVLLPGTMRTLSAIAKRLSFSIHRTELEVQKLMTEKKGELDKLISAAGAVTSNFKEQLEVIRGGKKESSSLLEIIENLERLSGKWENGIQHFKELSREISEVLHQTDEISEILKRAI